ncbi:hypothetical protein FHW69_000123 [Luteibacter sp. Sphag1AF]|uniref:DUF4870 domain-containing protein n=1 Tax=Luteibacter sp. Sphag1AF TaxID=2587031 RepID=UPI00161D827B|nr:DUF4870 domain-containing protein [Luteibacter sp. Sphag1AF]MBB3225533.1 hypothetical protein [Luteibacter sp. Sphag1AF]
MSTPSDQIPPSPPPAPPPYSPPPYEPPPTTVANDDRNIAMLTHLSGVIFNIIVPLIVWLIYKDRPEKSYLVAEAKEALNFQITVLIGYVVCWVLTIIVIGAFLNWLVWLANLVFCIIAAVKVSQTGTYRYPFALRLVN